MVSTHHIDHNFDKDKVPLWEVLGLKQQFTSREVDRAYEELFLKSKSDNHIFRLAWKLLRDPIYASSYRDFQSTDFMKKAGFFDDGYSWERSTRKYNSSWLTTPFNKITNNLENKKVLDKSPIVLLTTGGFSPIHEGHISMMNLAKESLENSGEIVIGGYISPSHDFYVSHKYSDSDKLSSGERIHLAETAVVNSDWLMVDSWESLYNSRAVNFTDVIQHLKQYLNKHVSVGKPIRVGYVFGSDNKMFTHCFYDQGISVCVKRSGSVMDEDLTKLRDLYSNSKRIFFVDRDASQQNISSTIVRKRRKHLNSKNIKESAKRFILLRDDREFIFSSWEDLVTKKHLLKKELGITLEKFSILLENSYYSHKGVLKVIQIPFEKQKMISEKFSLKEDIISLDELTVSKYNFGVSRYFSLSGGQTKPLSYTSRPGYSSFEDQLSKIPKGTYTLLDDDEFSGKTFEFVRGLFNNEKKIDSIETLNSLLKDKEYNFSHSWENKNIYEILDFRDFIFGARSGGLVVSLPSQEKVRAPYIEPYVSLVDRANIPYDKKISISIDILKLNLSLFSIFPEIKLKNTDQFFQNLMIYIGFKKDDSLYDICRWHLKEFQKL